MKVDREVLLQFEPVHAEERRRNGKRKSERKMKEKKEKRKSERKMKEKRKKKKKKKTVKMKRMTPLLAA